MSSTQILNEALAKIDYTNLRESMFAFDAAELEAENAAYIHANKVGHLAPDAPKVPPVAENLQRVFNKNAVREVKRAAKKQKKADASSYTYEDSQRKLTRKQSKYQAIDRTVIYNQMTSRPSEAVTASVTVTATPRPPLVKENKFDLLARITEITNRIMAMQEEATEEIKLVPVQAQVEPQPEAEEPKPDLSVTIHELVEVEIDYQSEGDKVLCGVKMPLSMLQVKTERDARRIINKSFEEFKLAIVELVMNPAGEEKTPKTEKGRFSEIKSAYSFKVQNSRL
jgi:hypothetical protein